MGNRDRRRMRNRASRRSTDRTRPSHHPCQRLAWRHSHPVLTTLNRAVQRSETNSFLTAAYAIITNDGPTSRLTLASGGHPLPILVKDDGATDVPKHSLDEHQWSELVATAARAATTADEIADNIRDSLEVC